MTGDRDLRLRLAGFESCLHEKNPAVARRVRFQSGV